MRSLSVIGVHNGQMSLGAYLFMKAKPDGPSDLRGCLAFPFYLCSFIALGFGAIHFAMFLPYGIAGLWKPLATVVSGILLGILGDRISKAKIGILGDRKLQSEDEDPHEAPEDSTEKYELTLFVGHDSGEADSDTSTVSSTDTGTQEP